MAALCGLSLLAGFNLWLAMSVFEPVAGQLGALGYVLVPAPFIVLAVSIAASGAVLAALRAFGARRPGGPDGERTAEAAGRWLRSLGWGLVTLIPALVLVSPVAGRLSALNYVFYDLRWCWWLLILATLLGAFRPAASTLSRHVADDGIARLPSDVPRRGIALLPVAALVALSLTFAVAFTPHLRFSDRLHGDERKYVRFCENFFQGRGFDISEKRPLAEHPGNEPQVLNNLRLLLHAVPEEAALLLADARRLIGWSAPPRRLGGEPNPGLFFEGKHPGSVYQLHNPGLSFLLFPGYYLDRRLTGGGIGYREEFPASLPAVHTTLLALYAAYGVAVYALLLVCGARRSHAWALALLGMVMMPVGALAFQMYPEISAGLVICVVARYLLARSPGRRGLMSLACGLLAGFLPWLHVRFSIVTLIVTLWALLDGTRPRRERIWFTAAAAAGVAALSLYTYRLTGSLVPIATYGTDAPLLLAKIAHGLPAFVFDRVWGLLPHAPLYLLALLGITLAWRRRRATVWLLGLIVAAVVVPAAGHGYWAAGATPGRYLVAVAPLLLVFVAETLAARSARPAVWATAVTLATVSLDTTFRYNVHHFKEYGPLVAKGFSGWRVNLLFPSIGAETWSATPSDVALLAVWLAGAGLLLVLSFRSAARPAAPAPTVPPLSLQAVAVSLVAFGCLGEAVAAATGVGGAADYQVSSSEARERVLARVSSQPPRALCYFSPIGRVEPTTALGNDLGFVDVQLPGRAPLTGEVATVRVRPRTASGEYVISRVLIDFGDDVIASRRRAFGDVEFDHEYARPGEYLIRTWTATTPRTVIATEHTITIQAP